MPRAYSDELWSRAMRVFQSSPLSVAEIAVRYGVSMSAVRYRARQAGLLPRPGARSAEQRDKLLSVLTTFHAKHNRMPTWKELLLIMNRSGRTALNRHLAILQTEGRLTIHPRGTVAVQISDEKAQAA